MLNMILAVMCAGCALFLACYLCKAWKQIATSFRVLDVVVIALDVVACALNLSAALI